MTEIEFDHPPINIYDVATRDALCEVLTAVIADPGVHVVVFTATGDHFSAGADLKEFGTAPSLFAMRDARWGRDVWGLLRSVAVPMVASMQGNAVGFGFELALQCDLRIAADDCVVALPEARVGMLPAGGASQTLPRVVGTSAGLAAVLTGERVGAADALARGFVDEVVPRADAPRAHRRACRRARRRVPPPRCAPPRPRCGRRSTSRSTSGCAARPTWPRSLARRRASRLASGNAHAPGNRRSDPARSRSGGVRQAPPARAVEDAERALRPRARVRASAATA